MAKTFRDYLRDSTHELPESITPVNKVETSDTSVILPKENGDHIVSSKGSVVWKVGQPTTSEGDPKPLPEGSADQFLEKTYIQDNSVSAISPNTPIIGPVVQRWDTLKDDLKQTGQNWRSFFKGLSDFQSNPSTLFMATQMLLRKANGPMQPPPYMDDTQGVNFITKLIQKSGINKVLQNLGQPGVGQGAIDDPKEFYIASNTEDPEIIFSNGQRKFQTVDKQGRSTGASLAGRRHSGGTTSLFAEGPKRNLDDNDLETLLHSLTTSSLKYNDYLERIMLTSQPSQGGESTKSDLYKNISDPFAGTISVSSPSDLESAQIALQKLNVFTGYQYLEGLSLRSDHNWLMRLYPYNPFKTAYPTIGSDGCRVAGASSNAYYKQIFTPPLPVTYLPMWVGDWRGLRSAVRRFDWEVTTPVLSYTLDFGRFDTQTVQLANGNFEFPTEFQYFGGGGLTLTILDDVDATFSKYMTNYINSTIDKKTRSRAPIEQSSFVAELIIFKPGNQVQYHFKFVVIPIDFAPSITGSSDTNDDNSTIQLNMSIIGMVQPSQGNTVSSPGVEEGASSGNCTWNQVTLTQDIR